MYKLQTLKRTLFVTFLYFKCLIRNFLERHQLFRVDVILYAEEQAVEKQVA